MTNPQGDQQREQQDDPLTKGGNAHGSQTGSQQQGTEEQQGEQQGQGGQQ